MGNQEAVSLALHSLSILYADSWTSSLCAEKCKYALTYGLRQKVHAKWTSLLSRLAFRETTRLLESQMMFASLVGHWLKVLFVSSFLPWRSLSFDAHLDKNRSVSNTTVLDSFDSLGGVLHGHDVDPGLDIFVRGELQHLQHLRSVPEMT